MPADSVGEDARNSARARETGAGAGQRHVARERVNRKRPMGAGGSACGGGGVAEARMGDGGWVKGRWVMGDGWMGSTLSGGGTGERRSLLFSFKVLLLSRVSRGAEMRRQQERRWMRRAEQSEESTHSMPGHGIAGLHARGGRQVTATAILRPLLAALTHCSLTSPYSTGGEAARSAVRQQQRA